MQSGKKWRCDSTKHGFPNCLGRTLVSSANGIHKLIFYVTSSCRSLATENDLQQFHVKCQFTCCQTLYKWFLSNAWSNKVKMFRKYILCRTPHVLPWLFFWIRMYTIAQGLGIMPNKYLEQVIPCDSWKYFTLYQLHVSRWCSESQSGWGSPASE